MNKQKICGLIVSASLILGGISVPATAVYAQTLTNTNVSAIKNSSSVKTENLTINFKGRFDSEAYLSNVNIKVIVNGKTYTTNYNYTGSLTVDGVVVNKTGNNTIKIKIPYFNTIELNTASNNVTVTPVETSMNFNGNTVLKDAVANAIGATKDQVTYYNVESYCYASTHKYGVSNFNINLSGKGLTNLEGIQELKGFNINSLNLSNNKLTNLESLNGLTINNLNISHNYIKNIDGINKISGLKTLNANYNYISSVTPLEGISSLTNVTIENNLLSTNPLSLGIKGLTTSSVDNNFIEGLSNQLQLKLKDSDYKGSINSIVNLTKRDVEITKGTSKVNETKYYSKYITLTSNNSNALTKERNGFKIDEEGTNYVTASVDGITNNLGHAIATIDGTATTLTKTENLTVNFGGMFDMESYLPSINVKVIVNGKTYNETYNYGGSLTLKNVRVNTNGTNTIKIEIPYFNTIELNTSSNNITVSPVETMMTFDGNKVLTNAVANAIGASSSELTYYNLESYCYAESNGFGTPLNINLAGKDLTNLKGIQELKGFDINILNLSNNKLTNLHELEGLTINNLNVSHNDIKNVDALTKVKDLQSLNISSNKISSTKELSSIKGLKITNN